MRTHKRASKLFSMFFAMMAFSGISTATMAAERPNRDFRPMTKITGSAEAGAPRLGFMGATRFMLDNPVGNTVTKALCEVRGPYCDSQGNCGWTSENLCCLWECWL